MKKREAFRLTALAAAMLAVLPCLAQDEDQTPANVEITELQQKDNSGPLFGSFNGATNASSLADAKNITISLSNEGEDKQELSIRGAGTIASNSVVSLSLGNQTTEKIRIDLANEANGKSAYGLFARKNGTINVTTNSLDIDAFSEKGQAAGIVAEGVTDKENPANNGKSFVKVNAGDINIKATSQSEEEAFGLFALAQGQITVDADNLTIDAYSENGSARGIQAQNNTENNNASADTAAVHITANNATITSSDYGIAAFSNGEVTIEGKDKGSTITIDAPRVIEARGNATVDINKNGNATVKLVGDIAFATPGSEQKSGNIIDANVNVNLTGADSSWTGNVLKEYPDMNKDEEAYTQIKKGITLNLVDGAQWNPTEITEASSEQMIQKQGINNLGMNKGVINMGTAGQVVQVGTLSGEGGVINAAARVTDEGKVETAQIQVNKIAKDNAPHLAANLTGVTADDVIKDTGALKNVVQTNAAGNHTAVSGEGGGILTYTTKAAEGDMIGELQQTVTLDEAGEAIADSGVKEAKNTVTAGLQKIAAMNFLTFRAQTNDVSKRMGDLRSMPQSDGAWGRVVAGQSEYKSIHNTYQTLQIGADKRIGNYYLGATASYTDGDGSLKNGSTDDKNYGFGLYGGWLGEDGQYVDVIIKRQKFESDFDLYNLSGNKTTGSYDTWGTSASVEYGWRLGIGNAGYYVEPQAELMFGHLNGAGYKTSNGVKIKQDGIDSAVGRAGLAAGWVSPDKTGSAYIKASILHDWEGDADTRTSKDGVSRRYTEEMGGTWGEFALGGTFNITKNLAAYGEVETTVGNPVRTTYQVSGGLRYSF